MYTGGMPGEDESKDLSQGMPMTASEPPEAENEA